jgi:hypothetical protein
VVVYDAVTSERVDYVYVDDSEKGIELLAKRLPVDARIIVDRRD